MDRNNARWLIVILLILFLFGWQYYLSAVKKVRISYSAFVEQVKADNVQEVTVQGEEIEGQLKEPVAREVQGSRTLEYKEFVTYLPSFGDKELNNLLQEHKVEVQTLPEREGNFLTMLIMLLPFFLLVGIGYMQYKRMQGQSGGLFSIGKSQAKKYEKSQEDTTFEDVAGAEGAKTELREVVSFLKEPDRIRNLGGDVPKGIMLVGPPGTGKTLLARAVAGEADVPFFSMTGSDFMEMFVGVGAKRVRSLFEDAKKTPRASFLWTRSMPLDGAGAPVSEAGTTNGSRP